HRPPTPDRSTPQLPLPRLLHQPAPRGTSLIHKSRRFRTFHPPNRRQLPPDPRRDHRLKPHRHRDHAGEPIRHRSRSSSHVIINLLHRMLR
ncbi:hypothetical protein FOZ63_030932, partial [Perkinsus olseni]